MQMFWKAVGKAFVVNAGVWTAIYAFDSLHMHKNLVEGCATGLLGVVFFWLAFLEEGK